MLKNQPTPWEVCPHFSDNVHDGNLICDATGLHVAGVWPGIRPLDWCDEAAAQIVLCVNAHVDLLAGLTEIISQIDQGGSGGKVFARDYCITAARAAIAKATGEVVTA